MSHSDDLTPHEQQMLADIEDPPTRLAGIGHVVREQDAAIKALVRAATKMHTGGKKKTKLPTIPIGTRVRVTDSGARGVGTVVGRDGYGFDGVWIIFDEPTPRGFEDGCCAGVEQCEVLTTEGAGA